jgi:DNA-binding transcriptional ArsR family regulator
MDSMKRRERRAATPEEARALANPLRLRILRLSLDQALTNKQLAERLDRDPCTVLHHVRTLVRTGFLAAEAVRQGERGALEKPYRATGNSWTLSVGDALGRPTGGEASSAEAMLEAFRAEFEEAGPDSARDFTRLALTLNKASLEELETRLGVVLDEFADRPHDPDGEPLGLLVAIHRLKPDQPPGSGGVAPTS